jgi:hypothetical protein
MPTSQYQNIYGDAVGLLRNEIKLEITSEANKIVKLSFAPSVKCGTLDNTCTVKAYFRYRLREVEVDLGTYEEFKDAEGRENIDLSGLGESWKSAMWQLKISGTGANEKFIFAWTDPVKIATPPGDITYNGESIFHISKDNLSEGVSWKLDIRDGLPTLVVSEDIERLYEELKTKTMMSSLLIVEAVKSIMDLICKDYYAGEIVTDTSEWQGKWLSLIDNECDEIDHPFNTPVADVDNGFMETYLGFKDSVGKFFMKKTNQIELIQNHYENINEEIMEA